MPDDSFRTIRALLSSTKPEEIRKGLILPRLKKPGSGSESAPLFEMITTLFYIDVLDPELAPVVDYAINLAVGSAHGFCRCSSNVSTPRHQSSVGRRTCSRADWAGFDRSDDESV